MAVANLMEQLKTGSVDLKDKILRVKIDRDGYTRTHEGQYNYVVDTDSKGELIVYPLQTDGKGEFQVMLKSPIIYTSGDEIHFVVNTVTDPYTHAFTRTENIKGKDKGAQVLQAFLAFVENRFQLGIYNIFVADYRKDYLGVNDEKVEFKKLDLPAHEDTLVDFPTGNKAKNVKPVDSGVASDEDSVDLSHQEPEVKEEEEDTLSEA